MERIETESIDPLELASLIEKGRTEAVLDKICPGPRQGYGSCEEQLTAEFKQAGGQFGVSHESKGTGHSHVRFGNTFLAKVFLATDNLELDHAIHEINTGLRIKDSVRINHVDNLTPLQSCCRDFDPLNTQDHIRFSLKFLQYPLGSLQSYLTGELHLRLTSSTTWKFVVAEGILQGLASLHEREYIHRDIKPDNILMQDDWTPMLADFGFAKKFDGTQNTIGGTRLFLAPEMKEEEPYSLKLDIWNVGAVIFYIVAPRTYKWTQDWADIARKACVGLTPSKLTMNDEVFVYCKYFDPLIRDMLEVNPERRPTAKQALERFWKQVERIIQHQNLIYENFAEELRRNRLPAGHRFWNILKVAYEKTQALFRTIAASPDSNVLKEHLRDLHPAWFDDTNPTVVQYRDTWADNYSKFVNANLQTPSLQPNAIIQL